MTAATPPNALIFATVHVAVAGTMKVQLAAMVADEPGGADREPSALGAIPKKGSAGTELSFVEGGRNRRFDLSPSAIYRRGFGGHLWPSSCTRRIHSQETVRLRIEYGKAIQCV
jgi:hypothetical protein